MWAQEKQDFPVILSSDYLAVPNNLLHSHRRHWRNSLHKHLIIRARVKRCKAFGQGICKIFRCLFCRVRWPSVWQRI